MTLTNQSEPKKKRKVYETINVGNVRRWGWVTFLSFLALTWFIGTQTNWFLALYVGVQGATMTCKLARDYRKSKSCVTLRAAALSIGVSGEALEKTLIAESITPRYIVDGLKKYAPEDLGEVMTLLRASEKPQKLETLLRPSEEKAIELPQTLLRPIEISDTE